jgi:two-component system, chemotaxis family, chemotaxis protein CheY
MSARFGPRSIGSRRNAMRVLIADDERCVGHSLADMVRQCGHEVVAVVGSGLEAIQAYTLYRPDLVLMDLRMPKLNGVTASRHIMAKNPDARIILISGWSPLDGADESGALRLLPKPIDLDRLREALNAVLQTFSFTVMTDMLQFNYEPAPIDPAPPVAEPLPFIPIPQEIISPVETFPVETFPLEPPITQNGFEPVTVEPPVTAVPSHALTVEEGSSANGNAPSKRRRNRRRRARVAA